MEYLQKTQRMDPKLHVAETGDFLLLEDRDMKSRIIASDVPYQSQSLSITPLDRYIHPSKYRAYILECTCGSSMITMYKYQDVAKKSVLPAH